MSAARERGERAKALLNSETFQQAFADIREDQVKVFLKVTATQEDRDEAHRMICVAQKLEDCLARWVGDASVEKKREQDRAND